MIPITERQTRKIKKYIELLFGKKKELKKILKTLKKIVEEIEKQRLKEQEV